MVPGESLEFLTTLVYEARAPGVAENFVIPASFFPWAMIRHLELRGHRMLHSVNSMKDQIMELHTLILEFFCVANAYEAGLHLLEDLISRVRGFTTLTLVNPVSQLPISMIAIHGETLVHLNIRHPRRAGDPYLVVMDAEPYFPESIDELRASCPHISSLTLDVAMGSLPVSTPSRVSITKY